MAKKRTPAELEQLEKGREHYLTGWAAARNEGIREGLSMAIAAISREPTGVADADSSHAVLEGAVAMIVARGDRHFGNATWQGEPRQSGDLGKSGLTDDTEETRTKPRS